MCGKMFKIKFQPITGKYNTILKKIFPNRYLGDFVKDLEHYITEI